MDGNSNNDPIWVEDFPESDAKIPPLRRMKYIGAGYFATMGNPVIAGRDLTWADVAQRRAGRAAQREPRARVLGRAGQGDRQAHAAHVEDRLGRNRRRRRQRAPGWRDQAGAADRSTGRCRSREAIGGQAFVQRSLAYVIRSSRLQSPGFLGEVQQAVWSVNPNLPLARVRTLQQIYDESMAQTQFVLVILGIAASVTLLLGLVGIYGVIAYIVSQRRREVGIRMALGAQSDSVQRIFVTRGLSLDRDRPGRRPGRRRGADAAAVVVAVRRESVRSDDLRCGRRRASGWWR